MVKDESFYGMRAEHHQMDEMEHRTSPHAMGGTKSDPVTFWAVLNMMYSDYCKIFKKHGVGDRVDFYADMASAWINDKDADRQKKTAAYYQYVVNQ